MTPEETDRIIQEIGKRQTLDLFDEAAIRQTVAPYPFERVVAACVQIRLTDPFIDAPALAGTLNPEAEPCHGWEEAWPAVLDLLRGGAFGHTLNPADFETPRAYTAARTVARELRTATPDKARWIFRDAWAETPDNGQPALPGASCTGEPDCPGRCGGRGNWLGSDDVLYPCDGTYA